MGNDLTTHDSDDGFGNALNAGRIRGNNYLKWTKENGWRDRDGLPPPSPMLVIAVDEALQRWQNNKPEYIRDKPLPNPEDLNSVIPMSEWEQTVDGKPRPPYAHIVVVLLVDLVTGVIYRFESATTGAHIAFDNLYEAVTTMRALRSEKVMPLVNLAEGPMKLKPPLGIGKRPHFEIISYKSPGGGTKAVPTKPTPAVAKARSRHTPRPFINSAERQLGKGAELASGFGGSVGAWRRIMRNDPRSDQEIKAIIKQWRDAHPATCKYWKDVARAARVAIRTGQPILVAPPPQPPITATFADGNLMLTLPSGRAITYPGARLVPAKFEDAPSDVQFMDNARGQWKPYRAWFGVLVENIVQGTARDLLAAAIERFETRGVDVVFHCHDEVTVEVPIGSLPDDEFLEILLKLPSWATGLPLSGRHFVAWSNRTKEEFTAQYFNERWGWLLREGGNEHVAAYLAQRDLSTFDPCALPRQTPAFFDIVNASQAPEDAELADVLDELEQPHICSLLAILASPRGAALEWLLDRRHRRSIPHRMERCGYIALRNPQTEDGLWRIGGRRQTLYVKTSLPPEQRLRAARDYVLRMEKVAGNS